MRTHTRQIGGGIAQEEVSLLLSLTPRDIDLQLIKSMEITGWRDRKEGEEATG